MFKWFVLTARALVLAALLLGTGAMLPLCCGSAAWAQQSSSFQPRNIPPPPPQAGASLAPADSGASTRQPAPRSVAAATSVGVNGYRIGVGDRVRVDVRDEPDLSTEFIVSQSGVFTYPFLGELQAANQTVDQLQSRIDRGLRAGYLVNPDVRVMVTEYRKFYINGEVKLPGGYSFMAGLTVRQAAALAGGFTERASMKKISVYREAAPTVPQTANLDTPIYPGDTVVVAQGLF